MLFVNIVIIDLLRVWIFAMQHVNIIFFFDLNKMQAPLFKAELGLQNIQWLFADVM